MKVHLIMPMSGAGSRFMEEGFLLPKPLIEIKGRPFYFWSVMSIKKYIDIEDITFIVLQQHIDKFAIDKNIYMYFPNAKIIILKEILNGPVFTCLEGIKKIKDNLPIIFNDCDHMFKSQLLNDFFQNESMCIDGGLITFESQEQQFSYIKYDINGKIIGTVEKEVVSNKAICGAYIFKNTGLFRLIAEIYINSCPYSECFLSGMYNVMCKNGMMLKDFLLDFHLDFGTPEDYEKAQKSDYFEEFE